MAKGDYRKIHHMHAGSFKAIMRALVVFYGSINKALMAIGISDHSYYRLMDDDELVVCVARKIINAYRDIGGLPE